MNEGYEVVGEAVRVEHDEASDKLFIVFEVKDQRYKQMIKKNWINDIYFKVIGKKLVLHKDK